MSKYLDAREKAEAEDRMTTPAQEPQGSIQRYGYDPDGGIVRDADGTYVRHADHESALKALREERDKALQVGRLEGIQLAQNAAAYYRDTRSTQREQEAARVLTERLDALYKSWSKPAVPQEEKP